jgi:hypothetical protein
MRMLVSYFPCMLNLVEYLQVRQDTTLASFSRDLIDDISDLDQILP